MSKKDDLKKDLKKVKKSIHTLLQSFEFCYYLNYPKDGKDLDMEHLNYIKNSGFFHFTKYALWRVMIVELNKLTSDTDKTEKFNLHKIIRKLSTSGEYKSLKIEESLIKVWEENLAAKKNTITKVKDIRCKVYAHTNNDYKNVLDKSVPTLKATKDLIDVVVKIVEEIRKHALGEDVDLQPLCKSSSLKAIIEDVLQQRKFNMTDL